MIISINKVRVDIFSALKQILNEHGLTLKHSDAVLLDATAANTSKASNSSDEEDLTAVFAVGLTTPSSASAKSPDADNISKRLSAALGGKFIDARLAMLSMDWSEQAKLVAKVVIMNVLKINSYSS